MIEICKLNIKNKSVYNEKIYEMNTKVEEALKVFEDILNDYELYTNNLQEI